MPPTMPRRPLLALLGAAAVRAGTARAAAPPSAPPSAPERVASFDSQVTGVAVSRDGRIFVCFPRWAEDVAISVGELGRDGKVTPYPNAEWNAWRNAKPSSVADHLVCVQSVTVDPQGALWIVDPAAPGLEFLLPGGPKLLKVDLATNAVVQTVRFDATACPQGSYLNDVRVSPDGRFAYLTDSGARGALLVVDLRSGAPRRVLDGHPSTQVEPDVVVHTDGSAELRRPDGRGPQFAADGVALDPKGEYLYWQALTGRTLYRIATRLLNDPAQASRLPGAVEKVGTTCVADGLWMTNGGTLYLTSPEDDSVKRREPDGSLAIVAQDPHLRWPDSLAEGADGSIYVTASHIQDMAIWHDKGSTRTEPFGLFRIAPRA